MQQNRASPFAGDFAPQLRVSQGISAMGINLPIFSLSREKHRSLAIFDRTEIVQSGVVIFFFP